MVRSSMGSKSCSGFFKKKAIVFDPMQIYGTIINQVIDLKDLTHGRPSQIMDPMNSIFEQRYLRESLESKVRKQDQTSHELREYKSQQQLQNSHSNTMFKNLKTINGNHNYYKERT